MLDLCPPDRKDKIQVALGAGQPPFPQRVHDHRPDLNGPLARFRFGGSDRVVSICSLSDVQLAAFEVYVLPAQTAKL